MALYGTGSDAFQWRALVLPMAGNGTVATVGYSTVNGGVRFCQYWDKLSIMSYCTVNPGLWYYHTVQGYCQW